MGKADKRLAWGLFWLASGVCAVIALVAAPPLPQWSVWLLVIFAAASFTLSAYHFGLFSSSLRIAGPVRAILFMAVSLAVLGWLVFKLQSLVPKPVLSLVYQGNKLDGQHIVLAKGINTASRPNQMSIDPNITNLFCLQAIGVENRGNASGHVQYVYLTFSIPVNPQRYSAPWLPDTEGTEFVQNWNGQVINANQPAVGIGGFCASPIPNNDMNVKLRVFYEDDVEEANFTIRSPR